MREIICIQTGQAGVQLSTTVWELLCVEHGVNSDGNLNESAREDDNYSFQSFFQEIPTGQFVPRAISVDLEPTVLDEIRSGPYRRLFHPDQLISGFEDAANNYARGHYTLGKDKIDYTMNRIRKIVDICENLQGFFLINSFGGGTGSGFTSLVLERLNIEFTKKLAFQVSVFPSDKLTTATVEPYNTLLCTTSGINCANLCNFFDNESAYNICCKGLDIPRPTYSNINRVIAQLFSSVTVAVRFQGMLNADLDQMITNLVPFPRLHFPIFAHAPIVSERRALHQPLTVGELTRSAFEPSNQLVNVVMSEGRYMCCCLQYRGDVTLREVNEALFEIKRRTDMKFVDWCPTAFKLGLNSQPPAFIPHSEMAKINRSATLLINTSAISQKFLSLADKFDILFNKRSFVHWYVGEGMEEMEFSVARDLMSFIISDYFEVSEMGFSVPRDSMSLIISDFFGMSEMEDDEPPMHDQSVEKESYKKQKIENQEGEKEGSEQDKVGEEINEEEIRGNEINKEESKERQSEAESIDSEEKNQHDPQNDSADDEDGSESKAAL